MQFHRAKISWVIFFGVGLLNDLVDGTNTGFLFLSAENLVQETIISHGGSVSKPLSSHRLLVHNRHKDGSRFLVCLLLISFPNLF